MKITRRIRKKYLNIYYIFKSISNLIKDNLNKENKLNISFPLKLKLIFNGYVQNKYLLYDMMKYNIKDFISDFSKAKIYFINHDYSRLTSNKRVFKNLIHKYNITSEEYGIIINGSLLSDKFENIQTMIKALSNKKIVIKPLAGCGGQNINVIEFKEEKIFRNYSLITLDNLMLWIKSLDNYIIEEFISQGDYINKVFCYSANTIRVVTLIDPIEKTPFISYASHRIGRDECIPVDNWSRGGILTSIDLDTGILSKAKWYDKQKGTLSIFEKHPDTNVQIEGIKIPHWKEIKSKLLEIAQDMSYLPMIGWDVLVTNDSFYIIEGNSHPDIRIGQIHNPLRLNPKTDKFYKYYKC